ncbi:MAG: hypothetical protein U1E42_07500 [Rhodospirillales bacterium]
MIISGSSSGALGGPHHGRYSDVFVAKYNADGDLLWSGQLGKKPQDEFATAAATDADGNIRVAGYTFGSFGGPYLGYSDGLVAKLSTAGNVLWRRQPATSEGEWVTDIATDAHRNIVITGFRAGSLGGVNRGAADTYIIKCAPDGDVLWKRQIGTPKDDWSKAIATDSGGNIVIGGFTAGSLAGPKQGRFDGFIAKFKP